MKPDKNIFLDGIGADFLPRERHSPLLAVASKTRGQGRHEEIVNRRLTLIYADLLPRKGTKSTDLFITLSF